MLAPSDASIERSRRVFSTATIFVVCGPLLYLEKQSRKFSPRDVLSCVLSTSNSQRLRASLCAVVLSTRFLSTDVVLSARFHGIGFVLSARILGILVSFLRSARFLSTDVALSARFLITDHVYVVLSIGVVLTSYWSVS